jgi:FHA domain-containing protein
MDRNTYVVGIVRGDRLVARYGDVVLFVDDDGQAAAELLAAIESAANTPHPGAAIAERLAGLAVGRGATQVPAFGVLAPMPDGLLMILRGSVTASIRTAEGVRTLSGERAYTWVDEVLPEAVTQVGVSASEGAVAQASPHTNLRAGVVPGGGFVLDRARAAGERPSQKQQQRPAETPVRRGQQGGRGQPDEGEPTQERAVPVSEAATALASGSVLVGDDGTVYPLDRAYVLGRDPAGDDAVRSAAASPIEVHNDRHVSRVHAYISIDGDMVRVRDASTPAGTFLAAPGAKEWTPVGTAPIELPVGSSLRIGERIFTHAGG